MASCRCSMWRRASRQTHLGPSHDNTLTIIDLPCHKPRIDFISRLPEELLLRILILATCHQSLHKCSYQSVASYCLIKRSLIFVSRRFNRIATPLLYEDLNMDWSMRCIRPRRVSPVIAVKRLHRTLRDNATLRRHCRILSIHIPELGIKLADDFAIANDIVSWLSEVTCVVLHGGFKAHNEETWTLVRSMAANMHIRHLSLYGDYWDILLPNVFNNVDMPSLESLIMQGLRDSKTRGAILRQHRTASFTSLELSDYEDDFPATTELIRWPKTLRNFHFGSFYNNVHYMDLAMFGSLLSIHQESLRTIHIGYLSRSSSNMINVSSFPRLEVLELSRWSFSQDLGFSSAEAQMLLAPRLKTFGWDFSIYDQHSESWTDFGEKEEKWLMQFGTLAASKSSLQKISITFTPDYWYTYEGSDYPWDRIDKVKEHVKQVGIELEYNSPVMTKEEWLEYLQKRRLASDPMGGTSHPEESGESPPLTGSQAQSPEPEEDADSGFKERDIREYFSPVQPVENTT